MLLLIMGLLFLAIHLLPVFIAGTQFWGFDSWSYLPVYVPYILFAIGTVLSIPGVPGRIAALWQKISKYLAAVPVYVWIVLTGIAFYLLGQKTFFLGDGYLRIRNLEQGLFLSPAEPLDTLVRYWAFTILKPLFNLSAAGTYSLISILSGVGMFTGLAFYLKKLYTGNKGYSWFWGLSILSAGFIQLFFAYVESYSIVVAIGILFFVSAIVMAKESKFKIAPALYYSFAVCFHPMALIFFPSYFYIYFNVIIKSDRKAFKWLITLMILPVLFGMVLLIFSLNGIAPGVFFNLLATGERFLPLITDSGIYGVMSLNHLVDFINQIILVAPLIIALPFLFGKAGSLKGNPVKPFLLISIITGLAYSFTINPVLGYARDWDMFAVALFPVTITIVYFLIEKQPGKLNLFAIPLVLISFIHTVPWIILNNSEHASVKRSELLAQTEYWDSHAKSAAYDELKSYYFSRGDESRTTDYASKAFKEKPSERNMLSLARQKINTGDESEALKLLFELSRTNYQRGEVTFLLGSLYYNKKDFSNAERFLKESAVINKGNYEALYLLGQIYMQSGNSGQAADHFKAAIRVNPNRLEAYTSLGGIYFDSGNNDDALAVFRKALSLQPHDAGTNYNLALCYAASGDKQNAIKYLKKAEENGFDKNAAAALRSELMKKQ